MELNEANSIMFKLICSAANDIYYIRTYEVSRNTSDPMLLLFFQSLYVRLQGICRNVLTSGRGLARLQWIHAISATFGKYGLGYVKEAWAFCRIKLTFFEISYKGGTSSPKWWRTTSWIIHLTWKVVSFC